MHIGLHFANTDIGLSSLKFFWWAPEFLLISFRPFKGCPPISPNPYMLVLGIGLGLGLGLGIVLGMGLGIGLGSWFDYLRQYNVIRRIGIRRNGAEPFKVIQGH